MVFSSVIFLCIYLPIVLIGYHILPQKARNIWLLVASLAFYACSGPRHLIYLLSSIVINYVLAEVIARKIKTGTGTAKTVLIIAIVANIASLVYFKYTGMLLETIGNIFSRDIMIPEIILPVGISFYTFQCMSYIIDVYRGEEKAKDLLHFALYITMFPQLLQGPIIRYSEVRDALDAPVITADEITKGIERFIVGLAKKAVIANTIGEVCDRIFDITVGLSTPVAWLGAILYTLQIYFDFSGYTDMAIGLGKMFGFTFRENFDYPYISRSITEFWRRWHISLSNWFRDYLYIPLGGNRRGNVYVNLLIVFIATGIWHGAAWSFIVWGLWHGLFMLIERALKGKKALISLPAVVTSFLKWGYTMLAVTLGWVLFKLEDIAEAFSFIKVMFGAGQGGYKAFDIGFFLDKRLGFFLVIAVIACVPWAQVLPRHISAYIADFEGSDKKGMRIMRHTCLIALLVISFIFIVNTTYSPFIYFRF
ncbi:MAG: MBOAT family protein [Lachnospiraceae bacterium]|nr:MBOAT family protein [Lachnospiraceae bacterium]